MSKYRQEAGRSAEEAAVCFLKQQGYRIIQRNYRSRLGEVDVVARDKDTWCFIEVKSRASSRYGLPQEAVTLRKQLQIAKAALTFLKDHDLCSQKARFDVVSVEGIPPEAQVQLIKNAFELNERFSL